MKFFILDGSPKPIFRRGRQENRPGKKITGGSHNFAQDDFNPGNSRKIRLKKRRIFRAISGADIKLAKSEFFP